MMLVSLVENRRIGAQPGRGLLTAIKIYIFYVPGVGVEPAV